MWSPVRQEGQTKIIGPAYTVKYVPVDSPDPKLTSHYVTVARINTTGFLPYLIHYLESID